MDSSSPKLGNAVLTPSEPIILQQRPVKVKSRHVKVYYGAKQAIYDLDIDIPDRAVSAFIGPSGCGKSTFLRCINRMNDTIPIARVDGKIEIEGQDIYDKALDVVQLRARVGMVFQKPNPFPKSIYENVAYGPRIHGLASSKAELEEIVVTSLKKAGLFEEVRTGSCRRERASPAVSSSGCALPVLFRSIPRSFSWTNHARRSTRSPPPRSRS